jgi:hypothetical protein
MFGFHLEGRNSGRFRESREIEGPSPPQGLLGPHAARARYCDSSALRTRAACADRKPLSLSVRAAISFVRMLTTPAPSDRHLSLRISFNNASWSGDKSSVIRWWFTSATMIWPTSVLTSRNMP